MNFIFNAETLLTNCNSLTLFRSVRRKPLFAAFEKLLDSISCRDTEHCLSLFAEFLSLLVQKSPFLNWRSECAYLFLTDDNPCTRSGESEIVALPLDRLAVADIASFERFASVSLADLEKSVHNILCARGSFDSRYDFDTLDSSNFKDSLKTDGMSHHKNRLEKMQALLCKTQKWTDLCVELRAFWRQGAGIFAESTAFVWKNSALFPVKKCDSVPYECLYGYEIQRQVVYENTLRFASGHRANNLLLYGDRGTGKSATVKAVASFFAQSVEESKNRLRIVEVRKEQLDEFARIAEELVSRDFRFIVFIDDLSFNETDERYIGLKALLEGGLESRPSNVVLYATSNRRHLVKEKAFDRVGLGSLDVDAEIRAEDAVQEHLSLADRFGMTVVFSSPDQDEYLNLVFSMLKERGLCFDEDVVRSNALRWEKWYNGRSPRTARQFADWFCAGKGFPWDEKSTQ